MEKKYLLISFEDKRAKKLAEVLGNKTCKKIINYLAEKESSEKDIADALKIPINTIEYNLKKLLEAELIEKSKEFFWSKKGKKIDMYKLSNKSIIISPRSSIVSSKLKSILPAVLISGLGATILKLYYSSSTIQEDAVLFAEKSAELATTNVIQQPSVWGWFLFGALFAIIIFAILNWRKI